MSYTPTEWKAGDTVTSAKLNKIEQGIVTASSNSGTFIVEVMLNESDNKLYLNITAGELNSVFESGKIVYAHFDAELMGGVDTYSIMQVKQEDESGHAPGKYIYGFFAMMSVITFFIATDENSYPVMYQG